MSYLRIIIMLVAVSGSWGVPVTWTEMTTTTNPPDARWNAGMAVISGTGYLFGGEGTPASGLLGIQTFLHIIETTFKL